MTDTPDWPDPSRPGVPLNPERDGWHWVGYFVGQVPRARFWYAEDNGWGFGPPATEPENCHYYGPILYPAEVAAREAAAFKRGAEAMRADCAAIVDAHAAAAKRCSEESDVVYRIRAEFLANSYAITQVADDVRVTPLPEPKT